MKRRVRIVGMLCLCLLLSSFVYGQFTKKERREYAILRNDPLNMSRLHFGFNLIDYKLQGHSPIFAASLHAQYNFRRIHLKAGIYKSYPRILEAIPDLNAYGAYVNARFLLSTKVKRVNYKCDVGYDRVDGYLEDGGHIREIKKKFKAKGLRTLAIRGGVETQNCMIHIVDKTGEIDNLLVGYPLRFPDKGPYEVTGSTNLRMHMLHLGLSMVWAYDMKLRYAGENQIVCSNNELYVDVLYAPYMHLFNTSVPVRYRYDSFGDVTGVTVPYDGEDPDWLTFDVNQSPTVPLGFRVGYQVTSLEAGGLDITTWNIEAGLTPGYKDAVPNIYVGLRWGLSLSYLSTYKNYK